MANVELAALAAEAHRRKISYGQLIAKTTAEEQKKIVEDYGAKAKKGNKGK